jgi:hypothetical protein
MGRGRAKAKQTKVARQLKYGGPTTDLERLQAELAGSAASEADLEEDELEEDPYAKYVEDEDELEVAEDEDEDAYDHDR